ncbi:MAG: tryptophan-rich sensory protein [Prevotella sp.]|jgi:tryptophan-rich sensory protein|nr:tryptophan-rich sensory protein [Prevotella sp.]
MKKTLIFLFAVISCLLIGLIISRFQSEAFASWYPSIVKSSLTPPDTIFTAAWLILYFFMGLSIGYIMTRNNPKEQLFLRLFTIQMLLSILWNYFYFKQEPLVALIVIVLLAVAVFWYLFKMYFRANKFSFSLIVPYFLWTLFCGYLNLCVVAWN